ncbi:agenet domain-containing protein / bromo-adjacent homology domain-containing protein [Prunus dulcis]|uniref:Agenet domain-containing protein / bromo-adjacent homology domain-containing protein n=1 Tax=Prunus dulcis TaxID=3755 RepID=A0A4Y1RD53_PRUDU|nr:agenet domain-containing protein / bromo-adjacent homology domain-containing protein [Prunus dulcis]
MQLEQDILYLFRGLSYVIRTSSGFLVFCQPLFVRSVKMSGNGHCFVEWKEHFVSQERGNRVVHYFLKDSAGESILAVVGTERSVRHMFYVVSEEFLYVHGKESSTNANFKWRSRREVVDWLTSMLSKQHIHADLSESPQHDSSQASGTPEYPMNGGRLSKNFKGQSPDIVWSGVAWTCGKQLKHFPAFCRDGITIAIKSFVFVMAKGENHYVAYIEDMYEDKRGQRKVKVRWFHHSQEVKGVTPLRNPHPKEVFITPYVQVISAECVDGPATVLTREHYEKCLAVFPRALLARVHLCCRQFKSNKVKPFDLSKMHGYFDQPILSCLGPNFSAKSEFISDSLIGEEDELGPRSKRTRSGRPCPRFAANHSRARSSTRDSQMMAYRPLQKSNYGSLDRRLFSMKLVDYQPWYTPLFKVAEKIELLCQDSGIRGCWFRCTVLQISRKQVKVQYDDLQDEEGCGNLEEWIPAFRLAMPDKLGIRHLGRPMIRPAPPKEQMDLALEVGAAIDARGVMAGGKGLSLELAAVVITFKFSFLVKAYS